MARWAVGSWKRIVHAILLGVFQPVVPVAAWVVQQNRLFDSAGNLLQPSLIAFLLAAVQGGLAIAILVGLLLCLVAKESPRSLGWNRAGGAAWGIAGGILVVLLSLGVLAAKGAHIAEILETIRGYSVRQRLFFFLIGAEIAFFEETVFRGYLQPSLVARLGRWGGVVLTAVLYASWHPPHFSIAGFAMRFLQGMVYGLLRERTQALYAPAIAHTIYWTTFGLA